MICLVTGTETTNKWKGIPICKNALIEAKRFQERNPGYTTREALIEVAKEFQKVLREKYNDHVDEKIKEEIAKRETQVVELK